MPRGTDKKVKGFIWVPRESPVIYDIKINSESIRTQIWNAEFTRASCPEVGYFKIKLDNNDGKKTDYFTHDMNVELFMDFVDGTEKVFLGKIDTLKNVYGDTGYTIDIEGNHASGILLEKTIAKQYSGTHTISEILDELNSEFLSGLGFTINCVATSTLKPTIGWDNKSFWECVYDLTKLADADAYVDDDLVIQFFDKGSILNENEALVWNDTLISTEGLGTQTLTKKDKIIVYGDDGEGLPVISVSGTGNKETVIFDTKITTSDSADELSTAELSLQNQNPLEGKATAFLLPSLRPGQKIWISDPTFKILDPYPIYKYTHKFYDEQTECFVQTSRETATIFKKRIENELALQTVTNPYKMSGSLNLKFDSTDELLTWDSNVAISESKIYLSSGSEGFFTASKIVTSISYIYIDFIGANTIDVLYYVSTDGSTYTQVSAKSLLSVPNGTTVYLKVKLTTTSEFSSIALLYK